MAWLTVRSSFGSFKEWVTPGETVYDALARAGIWSGGDCGGLGLCGKCLVNVKGELYPPGNEEKKWLENRGCDDKKQRLACLAVIAGDCEVMILEEETGEGPSSFVHRADAYPGLAIDLGTTTIVAALVDEKGRAILPVSGDNPQKVYGSDVVSRLAFALQSQENRFLMAKLAVNGINRLLSGLGNPPVKNICLVGNPVMVHLFLGVEAGGLAAYPYAGSIKGSVSVKAGDCGLLTSSDAEIYIPPPVGSYVGCDALAGVLELPADGNILFIDLGTNGEIMLRSGGEWWATSTAAGPAFEGAGIYCGMRAAPGAISGCSWQNGSLALKVIWDVAPRGICGSGLMELIAALRRAGVIDSHGVLRWADKLTIEKGPEGRQLVLSGEGKKVVLTQEDIRRFQLAKAAIRVAIDTLVEQSGVDRLERIYLAGAFGTALKGETLSELGVLPRLNGVPVLAIGNTALAGAARLAARRELRTRLENMARDMRVIELAEQPDFQERFLGQLNF